MFENEKEVRLIKCLCGIMQTPMMLPNFCQGNSFILLSTHMERKTAFSTKRYKEKILDPEMKNMCSIRFAQWSCCSSCRNILSSCFLLEEITQLVSICLAQFIQFRHGYNYRQWTCKQLARNINMSRCWSKYFELESRNFSEMTNCSFLQYWELGEAETGENIMQHFSF